MPWTGQISSGLLLAALHWCQMWLKSGSGERIPNLLRAMVCLKTTANLTLNSPATRRIGSAGQAVGFQEIKINE